MEKEIDSQDNQEKMKKDRRSYWVELLLFFVLGILVGIAIKNEAVKRITIGFDDYKMKIEKQDYPIEKIKEDLAKKQAEELEKQKEAEAENNKTSDEKNNSANN